MWFSLKTLNDFEFKIFMAENNIWKKKQKQQQQ